MGQKAVLVAGDAGERVHRDRAVGHGQSVDLDRLADASGLTELLGQATDGVGRDRGYLLGVFGRVGGDMLLEHAESGAGLLAVNVELAFQGRCGGFVVGCGSVRIAIPVQSLVAIGGVAHDATGVRVDERGGVRAVRQELGVVDAVLVVRAGRRALLLGPFHQRIPIRLGCRAIAVLKRLIGRQTFCHRCAALPTRHEVTHGPVHVRHK